MYDNMVKCGYVSIMSVWNGWRLAVFHDTVPAILLSGPRDCRDYLREPIGRLNLRNSYMPHDG